MKFDPKGIETALEAFLDCGFGDGPDDDKRDMENGIRAYLEATGSVIVPVQMGQLLDYAIKSFEHNGMEHWKQCEQMKRCRALLQASQESE